MAKREPKGERKHQILQAFALMLQANPGDRITTASLAAQVGVSEAALYRHFPSKAKIIEGLIAFAEDTLFTRIQMILQEQRSAPARCRHILYLLLSFVERNPGVARLFVGDVLQGETERLRQRMNQLMNRLEAQLRQVLREHNAQLSAMPTIQITAHANLMLAIAEGRIMQFVRSDFKDLPTGNWDSQWSVVHKALFGDD